MFGINDAKICTFHSHSFSIILKFPVTSVSLTDKPQTATPKNSLGVYFSFASSVLPATPLGFTIFDQLFVHVIILIITEQTVYAGCASAPGVHLLGHKCTGLFTPYNASQVCTDSTSVPTLTQKSRGESKKLA